MSFVPKYSLAIAAVVVVSSLSPAFCEHSLAGAASVVPQERSDTVVKMAGAPRYPGVATLVAELTISSPATTTTTTTSTADAAKYPFSQNSSVFPLRDGSLAVVDMRSSTIPVRLFSAEGAFVRTVGRFANAPGAYISPSGVAQLPDGRILVRDMGGITAYGTEVTGTDLYRSAGFSRGLGSGMVVTPDGSVFARFMLQAGRMGDASLMALIHVRGNGTGVDTILLPNLEGGTATVVTQTRMDAGATVTQIAFTPRTFWTESPLGYFITGSTGRYAINLRMPRSTGSALSPTDWEPGDTVVSIRRNVAPVAVLAAERAGERTRIEQAMRRRDPNWQWAGADVPAVKPPLAGVLVGVDGTIWAGLSTPSEIVPPSPTSVVPTPGRGGRGGPRPLAAFRSPVLFDVYEPDGSYKGQVAVPDDIKISARSGDMAWGVTLRTDNVYVVQRYRIAWQ